MALIETSMYGNYQAPDYLGNFMRGQQYKRDRQDNEKKRKEEEDAKKFETTLKGLTQVNDINTPEGRTGLIRDLGTLGYGKQALGLMGQFKQLEPDKPEWSNIQGTNTLYDRGSGAFKDTGASRMPKAEITAPPVTPGQPPAAPVWKGERFIRTKGNTMVKVDANGLDQAGNRPELWTAPQRPPAGPKPAQGMPGGPPPKAPTEDQSKAATFARRMELAENDLAQVEKTGYDRSGSLESAQAAGPSGLNSSNGQRWSNAEKNFATANLRKESGAVIGEDEMKNQEKLYFPRWHDSKETKAQKARNRAQAFEGMKSAAGAQFEKVRSMVPGQVAQPKTRAEKDALPSGTKYIGPDGKIATKQ